MTRFFTIIAAVALTAGFAMADNLPTLMSKQATVEAVLADTTATITSKENELAAVLVELETLTPLYEGWVAVRDSFDEVPEHMTELVTRHNILADQILNLEKQIASFKMAAAGLETQLAVIGEQIDTAANAAIANTMATLKAATIAKASAEAQVAQLQAELMLERQQRIAAEDKTLVFARHIAADCVEHPGNSHCGQEDAQLAANAVDAAGGDETLVAKNNGN